jgi:hypothetical protein
LVKISIFIFEYPVFCCKYSNIPHTLSWCISSLNLNPFCFGILPYVWLTYRYPKFTNFSIWIFLSSAIIILWVSSARLIPANLTILGTLFLFLWMFHLNEMFWISQLVFLFLGHLNFFANYTIAHAHSSASTCWCLLPLWHCTLLPTGILDELRLPYKLYTVMKQPTYTEIRQYMKRGLEISFIVTEILFWYHYLVYNVNFLKTMIQLSKYLEGLTYDFAFNVENRNVENILKLVLLYNFMLFI